MKRSIMKAKPILFATAPTEDGIRECIARFYCREMEGIKFDEKSVTLDGRVLDSVRVTKSPNGRFRFESAPK